MKKGNRLIVGSIVLVALGLFTCREEDPQKNKISLCFAVKTSSHLEIEDLQINVTVKSTGQILQLIYSYEDHHENCLQAPEGEPLMFELTGKMSCRTLSLIGDLGIIASDSTAKIGIDDLVENLNTLDGVLLNCSGTPVKKGFIELSGPDTVLIPVVDGSFTYTLQGCEGPFFIQGFEYGVNLCTERIPVDFDGAGSTSITLNTCSPIPKNVWYGGTYDLVIHKQSQIDEVWKQRYTKIANSLVIREFTAGAISDLSPLYMLSEIAESLQISRVSGLDNMEGFHNLTSIGGRLQLITNPNLSNLDGLSNLQSIAGGIYISSNPKITNLDGLAKIKETEYLIITNNSTLVNFCGLRNASTAIYNVELNAYNPTSEQIKSDACKNF